MILDPIMKGIEHQSLFPCKNRKKLFPSLGGVSFLIHQGTFFGFLISFRTRIVQHNFELIDSVQRLISRPNVCGQELIAHLII